ncbi:MAG: EFR1 family ferrodoxin [Defluviitaleaceae bacterium]|nr:EFR1 family ferrodoxin [Defluviitaleaceae bacterium]
MKNRIYFFTGTGNSLKVAKEIAASLPDCELIAIHKDMDNVIPAGYDRIGFVFPVYYCGPPAMVVNFIKKAVFAEQNDTYFFAIATHGGMPAISLPYMRDVLSERGIELNYAAGLRMFANGVFNYNMRKKVDEKTSKSNEDIKGLIPNIVNKNQSKIGRTNKVILRIYTSSMKKLSDFDKGLSVSDDCISCNICRDVCPAKNIDMKDGHPTFLHTCEVCLACLQHCPKRAINYKEKTQNRRHYTHPEIGHKEISKHYHP